MDGNEWVQWVHEAHQRVLRLGPLPVLAARSKKMTKPKFLKGELIVTDKNPVPPMVDPPLHLIQAALYSWSSDPAARPECLKSWSIHGLETLIRNMRSKNTQSSCKIPEAEYVSERTKHRSKCSLSDSEYEVGKDTDNEKVVDSLAEEEMVPSETSNVQMCESGSSAEQRGTEKKRKKTKEIPSYEKSLTRRDKKRQKKHAKLRKRIKIKAELKAVSDVEQALCHAYREERSDSESSVTRDLLIWSQVAEGRTCRAY